VTTAIPFLDLETENGPLRQQILAAIGRVVDSNRFIMGPEVAAFEEEIAAQLGVPHAIAVSSGTDALLVALMALGIGSGDEVITTAFSFFATAGCIARTGARPVFVDIDPETFNIDPREVEAAIGERTRAVLPVHLFGQPCDMGALRAICDPRGIPMIEDAAQAIGASLDGDPVGALGALGCFSFFPSKNLGCFGDGGLVTTSDVALARKVRILRDHGSEPKYFHALVGGNFRLDAIQAAVLRVKTPHLEGWIDARRRNAAYYDERFARAALPRAVLAPPPLRHAGHVYNQYVIRSARRDELQNRLAELGIGTAIYYPRPLHLQECFEYLGQGSGTLPEAERACTEVLALPIFPALGPERLARVADAVLGDAHPPANQSESPRD